MAPPSTKSVTDAAIALVENPCRRATLHSHCDSGEWVLGAVSGGTDSDKWARSLKGGSPIYVAGTGPAELGVG